MTPDEMAVLVRDLNGIDARRLAALLEKRIAWEDKLETVSQNIFRRLSEAM